MSSVSQLLKEREALLLKMVRMIQEDCRKLLKPYVDELVSIQSVQGSSAFLMPSELLVNPESAPKVVAFDELFQSEEPTSDSDQPNVCDSRCALNLAGKMDSLEPLDCERCVMSERCVVGPLESLVELSQSAKVSFQKVWRWLNTKTLEPLDRKALGEILRTHDFFGREQIDSLSQQNYAEQYQAKKSFQKVLEWLNKKTLEQIDLKALDVVLRTHRFFGRVPIDSLSQKNHTEQCRAGAPQAVSETLSEGCPVSDKSCASEMLAACNSIHELAQALMTWFEDPSTTKPPVARPTVNLYRSAPQEVFDAEKTLVDYFSSQGAKTWSFGLIRSRDLDDSNN